MRIIRHALLSSDKLFGIEIKFYGRFDKNLGGFGGLRDQNPFDIPHQFMHEVASFSTHAIKVSVQFLRGYTSSVCKRLHVNHLSIENRRAGAQKTAQIQSKLENVRMN